MRVLYGYSLLALFGGGLLTLMVHFNSQLSAQTSALNSSWFAHGLGAIMALAMYLVIVFFAGKLKNGTVKDVPTLNEKKMPFLYYLGGLPGAFTVVLASVTVNSVVGLTGTLALGLVGQLVSSMLCDHFGWFHLEKKRFRLREMIPILLISCGAMLLIFKGF